MQLIILNFININQIIDNFIKINQINDNFIKINQIIDIFINLNITYLSMIVSVEIKNFILINYNNLNYLANCYYIIKSKFVIITWIKFILKDSDLN